MLFGCDDENNIFDPEPTNEEQIPADFTLNWQKNFGTVETDDFAGMVSDGAGNVYIAGAINPDGFNSDVFLAKINLSSASIAWAKKYDMGGREYFPSSSENGQSQGGGGSRCLAIDASNNLYISGTSYQSVNQVFVLKIDANGSMLWDTHWKPSNTGTTKDAAKAYALDVSGNHVFVTGSTGAGLGTEEAMIFLLNLSATDGSLDTNTIVGIDVSNSYSDRGYTLKSINGSAVYLAGWEGESNSSLIMKFNNASDLVWTKKIANGTGARFSDIEIDNSENLYLATDIRGVSTYLGLMKLDSAGNLQWAKKYQGESNDRNNISCIRIIDNTLYVGGKSSYGLYDDSQWSDGVFLKFDLNGNLTAQYNYFTGDIAGQRAGERIEGIIEYGNTIILAGETWGESSKIDGSWFIPKGNLNSFSPTITNKANVPIYTGDGISFTQTVTATNMSVTLKDMSQGSNGSADIAVFSINK